MVLYVVGLKIANYFLGANDRQKWLTNNRYQTQKKSGGGARSGTVGRRPTVPDFSQKVKSWP